MNQQKLWNIDYTLMCLSSFFQYLAHYTLLAALPVYVVQVMHRGGSEAGLTLTFFQIGAVLFRPFAGKWIDDYDKRKVLIASLALFSIVCFLYLGVQTIFFLFVLRFFHGAGFSTGTTAAGTMVALYSPPSRMGEGVGYLAVFTSLAMVVGPFAGLKLIAEYSSGHLFAFCALLGLSAFVCGNIRPLRNRETAPPRGGKMPAGSFSWRDLVEPNALPVACCGVLLAFIYSSLLGFLPLFAQSLGMMGMASYFFAVYAMIIILTRPVLGKLFDRVGANPVIYVSMAVYLCGMAWLSQAESPTGLLIAGAVIGLGFGGLNPSFQTLAVLSAPSHRKGLATSTYFLSMDIGIGLGSFVLGLVLTVTDFRTMYLGCAAMVMVIAMLYFAVVHKK